jgi:hypothetical protein
MVSRTSAIERVTAWCCGSGGTIRQTSAASSRETAAIAIQMPRQPIACSSQGQRISTIDIPSGM